MVKLAYIVAFVTAGLAILSALLIGPIFLVVFALIPMAAGIGIRRGHVWSAYGYALFLGAQLVLVPVVLSRSGAGTLSQVEIIGTVVLNVALIASYFLAGRSLQSAGSTRGLAWPWVVISALSVVPGFFVQAFSNPSGGMEDTLLIGDRFLVQRWPRPNVARDMIVVFVYPVDRRQVFVKRVIGIPGDHIRISSKTVFRNGTPLDEPYAEHRTNYVDSYRDQFPSKPPPQVSRIVMDMLTKHVVNDEVVVPERSYFVLGDNRDNSLDSRYWGFITADDVIGGPILIYDSRAPSGGVQLVRPPEWSYRVRWNRLLKIL